MMILVTGGSGSGKSAYAEMRMSECRSLRKLYIATMYPYDSESHERILRHRIMRSGRGFETVEKYTDIGSLLIPSSSSALLECMSNLTANEMFMEGGAGDETVECISKGILKLRNQLENLVVVTNEIFSESGKYLGDTRKYQKYLGEINTFLADAADEVYEVVYGIPVPIKRREV